MIDGDLKNQCFNCKRYGHMEVHHIFGASDRKKSTEYGLMVHLCYECHRGTYGVHGREGKELQDALHEIGQRYFEKNIGDRDRFRQEFRKSYL